MTTQELPVDGLSSFSALTELQSNVLRDAPSVEVDLRKGTALESPGPRFKAWARSYVRRLVVLDVLVGACAALVPAAFSNTLSSSWLPVAVLCATCSVVWPTAVGLMKGYQRRAVGVGSDEIRAVLRAWVAMIVAGAIGAELLPMLVPQQREALLKLTVTGAPFAAALSLAGRFASRKLLHRQQRAGRLTRRVVVVGSAAAAAELCARLADETHGGMTVVGACVPDAEACSEGAASLNVLGSLHDVVEAASASRCDAVAVTNDDVTRFAYLRELCWSLEGSGMEMLVDPGLVEVAGPRMHIRPIMGFPLLHIEEPKFSGPTRAIKRSTDVALSAVGGILIAPLLLVIALAIKVQDGGPVLFKQQRVGRNGVSFSMYKFRSMRVGAERDLRTLLTSNEGKGGLFKMESDPRVTRLGRFLRGFSLDELPQLLNVLNGTMSLVGPRPHLAHELAQMPAHSSRRALVTPGMTGLWQVSGRSDLEGHDAVRLDLRYVENWSLTADLLILWKTVFAVLRRQGAK